MDLITPVQHASTYQALIDDVLEHRANRVEFNIKPDVNDASTGGRLGRAPPVVRKKFDIDPDVDPFKTSSSIERTVAPNDSSPRKAVECKLYKCFLNASRSGTTIFSISLRLILLFAMGVPSDDILGSPC